jgi:uncharacterized protein YpuA (DUF1002 family)
MRKKIITTALLTLTSLIVFGTSVSADAVKEKPYLALGADLKTSEKAKVLELLGVDEEDLDDYTVVTITNQDEHDYLDNYLSASVIGTRALSSVLVEKKEEKQGITVTTKNISYCTEGMYQNALTTAGVTDAEVVVAGPFEITGTAALVGAMKAYEDMTGEEISEDSKDAATNELVVTSELADELNDSEKAEQFLALIKEEVLNSDVKDIEDINEVIEDCAEQLDITITDEQQQQIAELMEKINGLDLDVNDLKQQASAIYDKLSSMGLSTKDIDTQGIFDKIKTALSSIFEALSQLF